MSESEPILPSMDDPELHPRLDEHQREIASQYGVCTIFQPGEVLFEQGERNASFHILVTGSVDIVERRPEGDRVIVQPEAGVFLGDTSIFTGQPTVAAAVAREICRVVEIDTQALRRLVAERSDIGDIILKCFTYRRAWLEGKGYGQARLIGSRWSRDTFELRDFLARHQLPFRYYDLDSDLESRIMLDAFGITPRETPVLVCGHGVHRKPTTDQLADALGLRAQVAGHVYDLLVVGAGPGGLAAAVYGASEGLDTLVVDANAPGGQAATSSKIENYLGFPTGLSGADLTQRAVLQAKKFGATLSSPTRVTSIDCEGGHHTVTFDDGQSVMARSIVIATGASYRRLGLESCQRFEGRGVYYGATHNEAIQCRGARSVVIGGGNSAGQAAVFLSNHAREVKMLIRGTSLRSSMSRYLVDRIELQDNIHLIPRAEVAELHGDEQLESVRIRRHGEEPEERWETSAIFVMIGADPRTRWLEDCVGLDPSGFVVTGPEAAAHPSFADHWAPSRQPFPFETTRAGIFAVGDARSDSVKRVASAVGEGAMVVQHVHQVIGKTV